MIFDTLVYNNCKRTCNVSILFLSAPRGIHKLKLFCDSFPHYPSNHRRIRSSSWRPFFSSSLPFLDAASLPRTRIAKEWFRSVVDLGSLILSVNLSGNDITYCCPMDFGIAAISLVLQSSAADKALCLCFYVCKFACICICLVFLNFSLRTVAFLTSSLTVPLMKLMLCSHHNLHAWQKYDSIGIRT